MCQLITLFTRPSIPLHIPGIVRDGLASQTMHDVKPQSFLVCRYVCVLCAWNWSRVVLLHVGTKGYSTTVAYMPIHVVRGEPCPIPVDCCGK